jgi:diguanylate cyclase (GGDEF)-like protein
MSSRVHELPPQAWRQVIFWTVTIIVICVLVSVAISVVLLDVISEGINGPGLVTAIVMPIILGGPIMFYMQLRHQQLKLANLKLDVLASTDWLTDTLNRRAFTNGASALLAEGPDHRGTLLVIDVDRFKSINDQFGHEAGDEALQLLAKTIVASVRTGDLVGRIGGEEFGVFLPGAEYDIASAAAERIRVAVGRLRFAPGGADHPLSVSIGGVTAADRSPFSDLFRIADQQLYDAKLSGRNRVELARLSGTMCTPANGNAPGAIDKTAALGL